ncbi:MAG: efflux RND transporter permease subunit [Myxococcales bacterium]|nr:efflux RND transporter permease subunit [Myxococcales bacterium]
MSISGWAVAHRTTIFVFMFVLAVTGMTAYKALPREAAPDITIPFVMVTTPYFGVSPSDIETLITNRVEDELEQLKDVREIRSTSAEGASIISIEFEPSVVIDDAMQKVRERVDAAQADMPEDAEDPIISEISFSEFPVIIVNVSGDIGILALQRVAEELEDKLKRIPGVLEVTVVGGLEREITVEADPARLEFYGVTLLELLGVVQAENLNLPGGAIDVGDLKYLVRVPGEFSSPREIEDLVIREENGHPITVRDVATVVDGYQDIATTSRLNQTPSISISISRRAGENILVITDEVKRLVAEAQSELGDSVHFATLADASDDIRRQLNELENNIVTGLILVAGVLFFFMGGIRNALFVASAIPLSMLISFAVLAALGITLNVVVLFSLVLALGMLVDNAIVTVENIYRHGHMGKGRVQAALDGVSEVAWPIISSTATTVFAFVPLMFWPGLMGEFMYFLPLTVVICLSASLFVALVINPTLSAAFMALPKAGSVPHDMDDIASLPQNFLYRAYGATLNFAARFPSVVLGGSAVLFVATFMLFGKMNGGVEFFPHVTPEQAFVNITLPDGSNVEASDRVVRRVERVLANERNIKQFVADVGAGNGNQMDFGAGGTAPHRSRITIDFLPRDQQIESAYDTIDRIRAELANVPGCEFEVAEAEEGPPTGAPISLELVGRDYQVLGQIAADLTRVIRTVPGAVDIRDDFEAGRPELSVIPDREAAAEVGVSTRDIANTVRAAVNGMEASRYREADDEYDIVVRMAPEHRASFEDLGMLTVSNKDGVIIPITEIATIAVQPGYGSIRHVDGERVVTLTGDVADGFQDIAVLAAVREELQANYTLPPGYRIDFTGQNQEQAEAQQFLGRALMAGLFVIALILITQFNSISQPVIIMASVLLSLLGVLWNLMIRGAPFNIIMTGIGIISLAGVVVNNAIVLIDYTNQLRARGLGARDAVWQAGMVRFRPVMLTALTTALSLLPTVMGYNLDVMTLSVARGGTSVEMWGPMAHAVVTGLVVATFLTLVFVPAMYLAIDRASGVIGRVWRMATRQPAADSAAGSPAPGADGA